MDALLPIIRRKRRPLVEVEAAAPVRFVPSPVVAVTVAPVVSAGMPEATGATPTPPAKAKHAKRNSKLGA